MEKQVRNSVKGFAFRSGTDALHSHSWKAATRISEDHHSLRGWENWQNLWLLGSFMKRAPSGKKGRSLFTVHFHFYHWFSFCFFFFLWKVLHQLLRQTWTNLQNVMLFLFLEQRNSQSSRTPTICLYRREAYYNELINQLDIWLQIAVKREKMLY